MSVEQENPELATEAEAEIQNEAENESPSTEEEPSHTEVGEHEYTIEELKKELEEAKQEAAANWDKAVRVQAEMENLKRRTQKDLDDTRKYALTSFAKEMLVVLDSVVLGLQAVSGDSEEVKKFKEGSELTLKQFESVFSKFNIVTIDPIGLPFNAEQHQAMVMQVVEGAEPNTVVNVFQKGYMLNGRLLRPAMVVVAKAPD